MPNFKVTVTIEDTVEAPLAEEAVNMMLIKLDAGHYDQQLLEAKVEEVE